MPGYRESYLFRIETDDPANFWCGHGNLIVPADGVLPAPTLFPGAGELVNIPDLESLINGKAQRLDITLSGVSPDTLALATEEAPQILGAPVWIGRVIFDEHWQIVSVLWEWSGEGRSLSVGSQATERGRLRSLTLTVVTGDTQRRRAPNAFFTDADQRRDYPTDAIFSHVAGISVGTTRRWGPK
ncbi:hypothetical protein [Novosphingobium olei]|uniref:hypothetical protein n=1 Tax=Novosphingobium olei TaxID=2728851 RepID=UPI00309045C5|nr:hypothetical protein NSDW_11610 [Novosphingobium olei]